jgi:hypothetical protein
VCASCAQAATEPWASPLASPGGGPSAGLPARSVSLDHWAIANAGRCADAVQGGQPSAAAPGLHAARNGSPQKAPFEFQCQADAQGSPQRLLPPPPEARPGDERQS